MMSRPSLLIPSWLVQCVCVSTVATISYVQSSWADFVFDDNEAILTNNDIKTDTPLLNVFMNDFWGTYVLDKNSHKSYRPLTVLTFRLNYHFGELDPYGYHLANILLHTVVSLLFLRVCVCLYKELNDTELKEKKMFPEQTQWWAVLFASLLFASHPIHTETVAGVVGRAELMSAVCYFLTLLVYRRACHCSKSEDRSVAPMVLLVLCCVFMAGCAMLFKEQGITIIGLCVVCDVVFMKLDMRQMLQLKIPEYSKREWIRFFIRISMMIISGVLLTALRMCTGSPTFKPQDNPASFENSTLTKVMSYNYLYSLNAWLLIHPWSLCFDWSMGCVPLVTSLTDHRLFAVAIFWLFFSALLLYCVFGKPSPVKRYTTISLTLVVVPFLPASNLLVQVGFVIAERVLYLPSGGLCLLVSLGAAMLSKRFGTQICALFCSTVIVLFTVRSVHRTTDWLSEEALFTSGIKVCPHNAKVLYNIGKARLDRSDNTIGEIAYREAIRLYPEYDQALNNLGNFLKETGRQVEAEIMLQRAVASNPTFAAAWMNLGIAQAAQNKTQEAETSYKTAISHKHKYPDAYYNLGNLYIDTGQPSKAVVSLREAIRLQNDHRNAWGNLALLYENMQMYKEAEEVLRQAITAMPDCSHFYYSLGVVMGKVQRLKVIPELYSVHCIAIKPFFLIPTQEGEEYLLKALEMTPDSAKYHANIGVIYHLQKDYFLAKKHYKQAIDIDPTMDTARDNLWKLMNTKH